MNKVDNIKSGNYVGYFWLSNSTEPEEVNGAFTQELDPNKNPFIIEAQLYDKDSMLSYSIKYVDGEHLIYEHKVESEDFNLKDVEMKNFISHRIKGHQQLKFLQYWREKKDALCENMPVLQPAELVFVGFND